MATRTLPPSSPSLTPSISRRKLALGTALGGAFSAIGITAGAAASVADLAAPDAGLLALCGEFHRLTAEIKADPGNGGWEAALDRRDGVQTALERARPETEAGRRAMAGVVLAVYDENAPEEEREASDVHRLVWRALTIAAGRA